MAGSAMTFAYDDGQDRTSVHGAVRRIIVDWTSDDTTGAVSGVTGKISGYLLRGVTDPDATAAPTDDYNIVLTDGEGANILANCADDLVDRDTANTESVDFVIATTGGRPCVCDPITIAVTAAGNSKQGRLVLYYTPIGS